MIHGIRGVVIASVFGLLTAQAASARAQGAPPPPMPSSPSDTGKTSAPAMPAMPMSAPAPAMPEMSSSPLPPPPMPPATGSTEASTGTPTVAGAAAAPAPRGKARYGGGARLRYISVPGWFLGLFTQVNKPLSAYGFGGEFYRRKGNMDMIAGVGFQKMGPPDGNWLGKGKDAAVDTDFVQFRNFNFITVDALFLWRTQLNNYLSFHYGAGLGLGIVTGKILRTSAGGDAAKCMVAGGGPECATPPCTRETAGDPRKCYPAFCPPEGCTETRLAQSEGDVDNGPGFSSAHRFKENSVPGALPILNLLLGFGVQIPEAKGLEFRFEGGFTNAFFLGTSIGYLF